MGQIRNQVFHRSSTLYFQHTVIRTCTLSRELNTTATLLNDIGFEWDPNEDSWMEMYKRLIAYKEKYMTTLVPNRWKEDLQLGAWVCKQRRFCTREDRIDRLNDVGFIWDASKYRSSCVRR